MDPCALTSSRDDFGCGGLCAEKRAHATAANMDSHFIDRSGQSLDIRNIETASSSRRLPDDIE
jgi:hypothetical protein